MDILTLKERKTEIMDESKLAQLDPEQLQEISELEDKIGVTLVAYDNLAILNSTTNETKPS
jgi:DNA transposition AAA+ family ATPase